MSDGDRRVVRSSWHHREFFPRSATRDTLHKRAPRTRRTWCADYESRWSEAKNRASGRLLAETHELRVSLGSDDDDDGPTDDAARRRRPPRKRVLNLHFGHLSSPSHLCATPFRRLAHSQRISSWFHWISLGRRSFTEFCTRMATDGIRKGFCQLLEFCSATLRLADYVGQGIPASKNHAGIEEHAKHCEVKQEPSEVRRESEVNFKGTICTTASRMLPHCCFVSRSLLRRFLRLCKG